MDIAWIIELWKAIHGGDPGPDEAREVLTGVLVTRLAGTLRDANLASQLRNIGNTIIESGVRDIARTRAD